MYTLTINFTSKYVDCIEQVSLNLFVLSHNLNFNRCEIPRVIPGCSQQFELWGISALFKKILLLLMVCRYFSFSSKNTHVIGPLKNLLIVKPLTPRSDSQFPPPATTYFLLNKLQEFGGRSRQQLLFVMFEYSHYLFAG